jgi:hypothetical protein
LGFLVWKETIWQPWFKAISIIIFVLFFFVKRLCKYNPITCPDLISRSKSSSFHRQSGNHYTDHFYFFERRSHDNCTYPRTYEYFFIHLPFLDFSSLKSYFCWAKLNHRMLSSTPPPNKNIKTEMIYM